MHPLVDIPTIDDRVNPDGMVMDLEYYTPVPDYGVTLVLHHSRVQGLPTMV